MKYAMLAYCCMLTYLLVYVAANQLVETQIAVQNRKLNMDKQVNIIGQQLQTNLLKLCGFCK